MRGTAVVSTAVENQLAALGFSPAVTRLGGANRYETAAFLSAATFPVASKIAAVSCDGTDFYPEEEDFNYVGAIRTSSEASVEFFHCGVSIPHGATVTKLSAGLLDEHVTETTFWLLDRIDAIGNAFGVGIGGRVGMALTSTTLGTPGRVQVSTLFITEPVIDNLRYGYRISCLAGGSLDLGIAGATIRYTLP